MLHLILAVMLICSSLGATLSKFSKSTIIRSERKHIKPLVLDKEV
jgi:hypothetical protein